MAPMGSDLINEYYRDTTNYFAATPVTVTAGNSTNIDAQLATGSKITGRITDGAGNQSRTPASQRSRRAPDRRVRRCPPAPRTYTIPADLGDLCSSSPRWART